MPSKRLIVAELLELTDQDSPLVHSSRARALAAGRPLLAVAQEAKAIRADLTIEQIFDMIVAIAKIHGDADYELARIDHGSAAAGRGKREAGTRLPIMKLSTLRDRLEAACPPCHHG